MYAFRDCRNIASVTCSAAAPPTCVIVGRGFTPFQGVDTAIPVYVPATSVADYQAATGWKKFTNIIGMDLTGIDNPELNARDLEFVYDLNGRRVENPTKGIYIVNGRKVLIGE